jgi:magnesium-transporting ATPase (P-type)
MREALGVCHTVIVEEKMDKETGDKYFVYNASSPDELALVNGAKHLGFSFDERDADGFMCCKIESSDEMLKYQLLNVIEFDSTRKRMTIIVRRPNNEVLVICKGADSIIEKRLHPNQTILEQTNSYLNSFAK